MSTQAPARRSSFIRLLTAFATAAVLATAGNASAQIVWTARESVRDWVAVASSNNGDRLVALAENGSLYTSADSGVSWTPQPAAGTRQWSSVACNSTGQFIIASSSTVVGGAQGSILTSSDYGVTWTVNPAAGPRNWLSVAVNRSYDPATPAVTATLVAAVPQGRIYTSSDTGLTWTPRDEIRGWSAVAISENAGLLVAADAAGPNDTGGQVYTATPATLSSPWTATPSGDHGWSALALSSTGSQIIAADYDTLTQGLLYKSTNSGGAWAPLSAAGSRRWTGVASSGNGQNLVAVEGYRYDNGKIYTSADAGVSWTEQAPIAKWMSVASSLDGTRLIAAAFGGQLYTGVLAVAPTVTTATPSTVAETSAVLGGNVTADGGSPVIERGIVWATTANPTTLANNKVANGTGTGVFSATVGGLPSGTTLHVRAYATTVFTTGYGANVSFTTPGVVAPAITSVTGPAAKTYKAGEILSFTVNYDVPVNVTGSPRLPLTIGAASRQASYASGSGTTALVFSYTVQAGDTDTDGVAAISQLVLNGGTIRKSTGTPADAALTFPSPVSFTTVLVDAVPPTVSSVQFFAIDPGTLLPIAPIKPFKQGEFLLIKVTMSEPTVISGNNPLIALTIGGSIVQASYGVVPAATPLEKYFFYTIQAGQTDTDGISVAADSLTLNGSTWADTAGNAANLAFAAIAANPALRVDTTAPTVTLGAPSASSTRSGPIIYTVTYGDANFGSSTLVSGNITLNKTLSANATVSLDAGTGLSRTITVSGITGTGTLGISLAPGTAADTAGNPAPAAGPSTAFSVQPSLAPSGTSKTVTTLEDAAYTVTTADFGFSDTNSPPDTLLAVKITSLPAAGNLTLSGSAVTTGQSIPVASLNSNQLVFTPAPNANGNSYASFNFQVQDNGGTANGADLDPAAKTITVNVTPVNDAPTLAAISNLSTILNPGAQTVNLTGISTGAGESQTLTVTAESSNTTLIPNPGVSYNSPNATGSLSFTPANNQSGTATITVTVTDNGGIASGGVDTATRTFTVTVGPNQPPSFSLAQTWTPQPGADGRVWQSVASSANGVNLLAAEFGGLLYTSANGGLNWSPRASAGTGNWYSVASSSDGQKLVAARFNGQLFTSVDAGVNWTARDATRNWVSVASSSDGTRLLAAEFSLDYSGRIFLSTDSGATWAPTTALANNWISVASSADGSRLVAASTSAALGGVVFTSADYGATWVSRGATSFVKWVSVASSSNGLKLAAVAPGKRIRTSTDAGVTWVEQLGSPELEWASVASSEDGSKLVAVAKNGYAYTSADSGVTWTARDSSRAWTAVASSSDGSKLLGAVAGGRLFTSTDSGAGWIDRPIGRLWYSVASSADGSLLIAAENALVNNGLGRLHRSTDGGLTWVPCNGAPSASWLSVASSTDGMKLVAVAIGGRIHTSADGGVTWTARDSVRNWWAVASSSAGDRLAAVESGGLLYTSADSGVTWTPRSTDSGNPATTRFWRSVASSSDGSRLIAVADGSQIYVSTNYGADWTAQGPTGNWVSVASSSNGMNLVAAQGGATPGQIYTSTDGGVNWTAQPGAPTANWGSVASSADGRRLVASAGGFYVFSSAVGKLYTSLDGGVTWTAQESDRIWTAVASSADASRLAAVAFGGQLYTLAAPSFVLTAGSGAQIVNAFASNLNRGAANEAGQTLTFQVTGNTNPGLFTTGPAIDTTTGNLTYTPGPGSGTATVTVVLKDNGGTSGGGNDTSPSQTFTITVLPPNQAPSFSMERTWTQRIVDPKDSSIPFLQGVAGSADGTKLFAIYQDRIQMSSDSGTSWVPGPSVEWRAIACTADGSRLVASTTKGDGDYIYTSSAYGAPLVPQTGSGRRYWADVASSADGAKLVALDEGPNTLGQLSGGKIWTSADYGVTWTERTIGLPNTAVWVAVASSADGTRLAAIGGGQIYTSSDSGATWTARTTGLPTTTVWTAIASSSDGTRLAATGAAGIYTSVDSGATWTARTNGLPTAAFWSSIASSADGTRLAAAGPSIGSDDSKTRTNLVYTSVDSGLTWTMQVVCKQEALSQVFSIFSSADGSKLMVPLAGGQLYTSDQTFVQNVADSAGPQRVPDFVKNPSPGPASESGQALSYQLSGYNAALFSVAPAIALDGTLTYTPALNQSGTTTVTVRLQDSGPGTAPNVNLSAPQTFTITVFNALETSNVGGGTIPLINQTLVNNSGGLRTLSNAVTLSGNSAVSGSSMVLAGPITLAADTTLNVGPNGLVLGSGLTTSSPSNNLVKTGPGVLVLSASSFNGNLVVLEGTVVLVGDSPNAKVILGAGATLKGVGTVFNLAMNAYSTLATGNSPGTLGAQDSAVLQGGYTHDWEINRADGTAGSDPGWDLLSLTGTLTLDFSTGLPINVNLLTLAADNTPGPMVNFNNQTAYAWKIASAAGGIIGFDPAMIRLQTDGFANPTGTGTFGIELRNAGKDLVVTYTPAMRTNRWTGDADSGIDATRGTLWARRFGVAPNATINGVTLTGTGYVVTSPEFDLAGPTSNYNIDDTNNLTGLTGQGSAEVAKRFSYGGNPTVMTFKQLTPGYTYTASIFTVGFDTTPGIRVQTFSSGTDSRVLDPNVYGDNAGCRIDYTFTADAATRTVTITPPNANYTFALYGVALRQETLLAPVVSGASATAVTGTGATLNATATGNDARAPIIGRGFVFAPTATNPAPARGGAGVTEVVLAAGSGAFTTDLTSLAPGTQYSFAAYAENSEGTTYTPVSTFATLAVAPTITSPTQTSITASTATLGGNVTADGGASITERGVVYSLTTANGNPLIGGTSVTKVTNTGTTGVFTVALTGLEPGKGYSFKAYATNSKGTTYTSPVSTFTTLAVAPTVTTPTQTAISSSGVTVGGTVTKDGGATITERGVVYSLTAANSNPLIAGTDVTKMTAIGTTGVFTVSLTGLEPGKSYSFKAYAANSKGIAYTSPVSTFTTLAAAPTVTTPSQTSITSSGATLGGKVTQDGGAAITERGVVYSLTKANSNPLIGGTGVTRKTSTGSTGVFTVDLRDLAPGKGYSFKAYATNSKGTTYTSPVSTFTTLARKPTVTTPTKTAITSNGAKLGGKVTSDGGAKITSRGVVYSITSKNSNPLIGGTGVTRKTSTGTTGLFAVTLTDLKPGTRYSFKAFATNSKGTTYTSPISTFTTPAASAAIQSSPWMDAARKPAADTWKTLTTIDAEHGVKYLSLVITKPPGTEHRPRIVEVSGNLIDWFSGPRHTTILRDDADFLKVRDNTPLVPGTKRYIRLKP